MVWGLGRVDFTNAGWNGLHMSAHFFGGMAVAAAVNGLAHSLMKPKKDSGLSNFFKFISFVAGTAASVYLAPRSTMIDFATGIALKVAAINFAGIAAGLSSFEPFAIPFVVPFAGSLGGLGGQRSFYIVGGLGSALGVAISDQIAFPPKKTR